MESEWTTQIAHTKWVAPPKSTARCPCIRASRLSLQARDHESRNTSPCLETVLKSVWRGHGGAQALRVDRQGPHRATIPAILPDLANGQLSSTWQRGRSCKSAEHLYAVWNIKRTAFANGWFQ